TGWRAPIEQTSGEKAESFAASFEAIASDGQMLGNYVFLWGQKQERTPTWYGMFIEDGSSTETVDVTHYVWNGEWAGNRSPRVRSLRFDARTAYESTTVAPGGSYGANVRAFDPDGDAWRYYWEITRESRATERCGGPEETPEISQRLLRASRSGREVMTV